MKHLLTLSTVAALFFSNTAHSAWDQTPPAYNSNFPFPPVGLASNISTIGGVSLGNGQYVDAYYSNKYPWSAQTIQNATCVFVHFHGGGWYTQNTRYISPPGTPEELARDLYNVIPTLANRLVKDLGCIMLAMSYPLSDVNVNTGAVTFKVSDIIGDINIRGSAFNSFEIFYRQHYEQWKSSINPNLALYVGGESAGAYIAQRIATNGRWPVSSSMLMALPTFNPGVISSSMLSELSENSSDQHECSRDNPPALCSIYRNLYGSYNGSYNQLDLSNYVNNNPNLSNTIYLANACDEIAEIGSSILGWFSLISANKKTIAIHNGFSTASSTGHTNFTKIYQDFFDSVKANDSNLWIKNSLTGITEKNNSGNTSPNLTLPASGKYKDYCLDNALRNLIRN